MEPIKCKTCSAIIKPLQTGTWINLTGNVYCMVNQYTYFHAGDSKTLIFHEPLIPQEWAERIRTLAASSTAWTSSEIAKLTQLSEELIKKVLNGS